MQIYLVNVGTNASDGFAGPLFDDSSFEFVPIREYDRSLDSLSGIVHYRDLRSYCNPDADLLDYTPSLRHDQACHRDPDFEAYTYGDDVRGGRAANLRHARPGDVLLFLARLERWANGQRTRQYGFYLLGGLHIENVYANVVTPLSGNAAARVARNAHVIRAQASGNWAKWGGFHVFTGTDRSRRFQRAVPITRPFCENVFRDKNGIPWHWPANRSDLSVIGSYTRTCRCMLDTSDSEQALRAATLHAWIRQHAGEHDATLLVEES